MSSHVVQSGKRLYNIRQWCLFHVRMIIKFIIKFLYTNHNLCKSPITTLLPGF